MYLREAKDTINESRILDFHAQAEQLLQLLESRLEAGLREAALKFLEYKFQTLYAQGVANGRRYEQEGVFPY